MGASSSRDSTEDDEYKVPSMEQWRHTKCTVRARHQLSILPNREYCDYCWIVEKVKRKTYYRCKESKLNFCSDIEGITFVYGTPLGGTILYVYIALVAVLTTCNIHHQISTSIIHQPVTWSTKSTNIHYMDNKFGITALRLIVLMRRHHLVIFETKKSVLWGMVCFLNNRCCINSMPRP